MSLLEQAAFQEPPGPWPSACTTNSQVCVGSQLCRGDEAGFREGCGVSVLHPVLTPVSGVTAALRWRRVGIPRHPPQAMSWGKDPASHLLAHFLPPGVPPKPNRGPTLRALPWALLCLGLEARREYPKQVKVRRRAEAGTSREPVVSWGSAIEGGFQQERGKTRKLQPPASSHVVPCLPTPPHSPASL